jgi:hypothetical protein
LLKREKAKDETFNVRVTLNNSLTLNLDIRPQRQLLDRHARAAGLHIAPVLLVGLVHAGEERHVGEEDVDFEDGFEAAVGGLQDGGEVLDGAVLFGRVGRGLIGVCWWLRWWLRWWFSFFLSFIHSQYGPRPSPR